MVIPTKKTNWEERINTFLLSVVTAGVIGCFGFLWNMNNSITRLQEHDVENNQAKEEMVIKINNMQLDIRDIRERLIRVEAKQKRTE